MSSWVCGRLSKEELWTAGIQQEIVTGQLDKGVMQIGWVFGFMAAAIVATWLWSVIWATRSEEKRLRKHAVIASIVPANITVVLMAVQSTV